MAYCPKCGGTGIRLDGSPCDCERPTDTLMRDLVGIDIPEQYQGVLFNQALVPNDLHPSYAATLNMLHDEITTMNYSQANCVICSPPRHSKTIFAYSCIQLLFRKRVPVLPLYDIMEIKKQLYRGEDEDLYNTKYLIVRIPADVNHQVRTGVAVLLDRRVRRGNSTIFLFNGTWSSLCWGDDFGTIKGLQGDGSYGSLRVYSYHKEETQDGIL